MKGRKIKEIGGSSRGMDIRTNFGYTKLYAIVSKRLKKRDGNIGVRHMHTTKWYAMGLMW